MIIQEPLFSSYYNQPLVSEEVLELIKSEFDELSMNERGNDNRRMGRKRHTDNDDDHDAAADDDADAAYKSKNLKAERRRRQKLSDRLLELRASMNKASIITDAITYIEQLQKCVRDLSSQLFEMEAASVLEESRNPVEEIKAAEEMKKWGIEPEVKVTQIDGNKVWIRVVLEKKRGGFTKLMEAMSVLGYEFTDTNVTSSKGAILVASCLVGTRGGKNEEDQIKELLLEITRGM